MTNNYHFCFISYILFHFDCSNPDYFSTGGVSTFGLVPKAQCTKSTTCCGLTCPTSLNWFWLTSHATIHLCCKVLLVQIILTIYKSVFKAAKKCLKTKRKKENNIGAAAKPKSVKKKKQFDQYDQVVPCAKFVSNLNSNCTCPGLLSCHNSTKSFHEIGE